MLVIVRTSAADSPTVAARIAQPGAVQLKNLTERDEELPVTPSTSLLTESAPESSSSLAQPVNLKNSSTPFFVVLAAFAVLITLRATETLGEEAYTYNILIGITAGVVGLRRSGVELRWPWLMMISSGAFWFVGSAVSDHENTFRNLTDTRSLVGDMFSIPGYFAFGIGLVGMLRMRRRGSDANLLLDSIVLAFGAALIVHHTLIDQTLQLDNTWLPARLAVAAYPTAALLLLAISAQLALSRGRRSCPFILLMVGTAGMFVGDLAWAFGEIGTIGASSAILDVPFMLVPASIGLALLHPGIEDLTQPPSEEVRNRSTGRYIAVSSAMIAPAALVVLPGAIGPVGMILSLGLCTSSAIRVAVAIRNADTSHSTLVYRATHDDLTDLPTRPLLVAEIDRRLSIVGGESVSLLFVDLDRFKNVNDLMGHPSGDELLVAVAARIVEIVRSDDVVARLSGDEFVVVTSGLSVEGSKRVANRIRVALTDPFELSLRDVIITASVGVSRADSGGTKSAALLLQEADTAMYESKAGRNATTVFDATMQDRTRRRIEIEQLLRNATESPGLEAHYQPIIDAERGAVVGFEALLRWTAMGERISPDEFIPIAEDSGLIVPIGAFVLDEACRQAAWWRANIPGGQDLYVSVNLSARQVISPDIVDVVDATLLRHQLPASALWLEITETVMTEDSAVTAAAMTGLRSLGVRLALDDFGTGYSSLSGLQYLPVSRLKIDRRFVMALGSNQANEDLVRCITAVAGSFDLDIVAEGVETRDQQDILETFGCSLIQGWLYSPAVPADDVPATFAAHHREVTRRHRPTVTR